MRHTFLQPPRITIRTYVINDTPMELKFVRRSWLCRWIFRTPYKILGQTVYIRGGLVTRRMLRNILTELSNKTKS